LRRVLEFITGGGLEAARARELRSTPTSAPATAGADSWTIMKPLLQNGDDSARAIINTLVSFSGRRKP